MDDINDLFHLSVMPDEVISLLNIVPDGTYVDMTLGDGGHSILIMKRLSGKGRIICFDKDMKAIERAKERLGEKIGENYTFINNDFAQAKETLFELGVKEVDGFVFDLGVSSAQLDDTQRGFSFSKNARLDMRMDMKKDFDAHKLVNTFSYEDLRAIIKDYGEERYAGKIAAAIVKRREEKEISTTGELADIVSGCIPKKFHPKKIHPATRTFQALRIRVNDELVSVEKGVRDAVSMLKKGGRVSVISFNSLEDRIVKKIFKEGAKGCTCPKQITVCLCGKKPYLRLITSRPRIPSELEVMRNPRARSAKLRTAERI